MEELQVLLVMQEEQHHLVLMFLLVVAEAVPAADRSGRIGGVGSGGGT
jgi:hypothetical protein